MSSPLTLHPAGRRLYSPPVAESQPLGRRSPTAPFFQKASEFVDRRHAIFNLRSRALSPKTPRPRDGFAIPPIFPSHGVFPVKLIRLGQPLACHPRSRAKRRGSEAPLTRLRPDTLSGASAPLRSWLPLWPLRHAFFLPLRLLWRLDPKREPVIRHAASSAASPHIQSSFCRLGAQTLMLEDVGLGLAGPSC